MKGRVARAVRSPAAGRSGFSLVEVLVSLLVLTVVLSLALPLVIEALRLLGETGRRSLAQDRAFALAKLRRDVEETTAFGGTLDELWREAELVLFRGGRRVTWAADEDAVLWRVEISAGGEERRRRMVEHVVGFRQRQVNGVVEIEVSTRDGARPTVVALAGALPHAPGSKVRREHLVIAPRLWGKSGRW